MSYIFDEKKKERLARGRGKKRKPRAGRPFSLFTPQPEGGKKKKKREGMEERGKKKKNFFSATTGGEPLPRPTPHRRKKRKRRERARGGVKSPQENLVDKMLEGRENLGKRGGRERKATGSQRLKRVDSLFQRRKKRRGGDPAVSRRNSSPIPF